MIDPILKQLLDPRALASGAFRRKMYSRALITLARRLPTGVRRWLFQGERFHCPVCDSGLTRLLAWGELRDACCPVCTAFSWHRFSWLFLERQTDLFDGAPKRMLHVAPEPALARRFRELPGLHYVTADLMKPGVMVHMDLMTIPFSEQVFDVAYCSHVLEHVPDPKRALRELLRVLRPGCWALIVVPTFEGPSTGDPSVTNPAERERLFGQHDHFWRLGSDFAAWIEQAGFEVDVKRSADVATEDERLRMALFGAGPLFLCRRPTGGAERSGQDIQEERSDSLAEVA